MGSMVYSLFWVLHDVYVYIYIYIIVIITIIIIITIVIIASGVADSVEFRLRGPATTGAQILIPRCNKCLAV